MPAPPVETTSRFAAPAAAGAIAQRMRLPALPARFVGRDAERERLRTLLPSARAALICGVAGVGKTALATVIAAEWPGPVVFRRLDRGVSCADLGDDLRCQLGAPAAELSIAGAIDPAGALWVLDDLHLLAPAEQRALLELAAQLRHARLLATSRELLQLRPGDPDVLQLKLDRLDEPHGRQLWAHLDELYGPASGFEWAWARARGNPLLLRQVRVAPLDDEHPLQATWDALSDDERRLAGALAIAHTRLPVDAICGLLPDDRARGALRGLSARLVVDVDLDRGCTIHELFRELALTRLDPAARAGLCAAVAGELRRSALDPVTTREVSRLLDAAGEPDAAAAYLLSHSTALIRRGAAAELLAGLDAIPVASRTADVHIARARARVRRLELRVARDDLERLRNTPGASPERNTPAVSLDRDLAGANLDLELARGQVAVLLGRTREAEQALVEALDRPASPALHTRTRVALAVLRCYQGRGDEARALIDAGEPGPHHPLVLAQLAIGHAICSWIDERHRETADSARRALELVPGDEPGLRAGIVARGLLAGAVAQQGSFDEAERLVQLAEQSLSVDSDLRVRADLRGIAATIAFAAGRRGEARAGLEAVQRTFERAGYLPALGWSFAWLGRVLLSLGQRRAGLAQLVEARAIADATGLAAIAHTVARSHAEDVASPAWLARPPCADPARPVERVRANLSAAIRAASIGDAQRMQHLLARAAPPGDGDDWALDRALAELAGAVLARALGDPGGARQRLATATAIAADAGADPDLVPAVFAMVDRVRIDGAATPTAAASRPAAAADPVDLIVDTCEHALHAGRRTVSLEKHPRLRAALYAFAAAPAYTLAKEALVHAIWGVAYDPLAHDRSLKANMHRLRRLLESTGIRLVHDGGAYRLDVRGRLLVLGLG